MSAAVAFAVLVAGGLPFASATSISLDLDSQGNAARLSAVMRREAARPHEFGSELLDNATANATATTTDTSGHASAASAAAPAANATAAATGTGTDTGADAGTASSTSEEATAAPITSEAAPTSALARPDLSYDYVEEKLPGACDSHYEYQGLLSNDECAARCYATYGCTRFSAGGCELGCRISKPNTNNPSGVAVPADGQCPTTAGGHGASCVVFQLAFFHVVDQPGTCNAHFEMVTTAQNKADCAHACKNTAGCTKFTAEPNCMAGCRISKCNSNARAGTVCPTDSQCTLTTESGCTMYKVFR